MKFVLKQLPVAVLISTWIIFEFMTIRIEVKAVRDLLVTITIFFGLFVYHFTDSLANAAEVDAPTGKPHDKFTDPLFAAGYMNRMAVASESKHKGQSTVKSRQYRIIADEAIAATWNRKRRFWTRLLFFAGFIILDQTQDLYRHKVSWIASTLCFMGMWVALTLFIIPLLINCVRRYDFGIERVIDVDSSPAGDTDHADDAVEDAEDLSVEVQRDLDEHQWALGSMKYIVLGIACAIGGFCGFFGDMLGHYLYQLYRAIAH
jgi:hypothetical protein